MTPVPIKVAGELELAVGSLPVQTIELIKSALTVENEDKAKAASIKQFGWWDMPDVIALWRQEDRRSGDKVLLLPRGVASWLTWWLPQQGFQPVYEDHRTEALAEPGYYEPFVLRDYQLDACLGMLQAEQGIYKCPAGGGKGHPLDTEVPTPQGFRRWGDLEVGDEVLGSDGRPTKVTAIFDRGVLPTYMVVFSDHTAIRCDAEHIWRVADRSKRRQKAEWSNKTTAELLELGIQHKEGWRWRIPIQAAHYDREALPLDPYLVGALIANGGLTGSGTILTTPDPEVIDQINLRPGLGEVHKIQDTTDLCDRYSISGIQQVTQDLGMRVKSSEKRVPEQYKRGLVSDRVSLLMGLMDGDGSARKGRRSAIYHTTSCGLACDVAELVRSLGGTASVGRKEREGKPLEFPVYINPPVGLPLFSTPRKRSSVTVTHRKPIRSIVDIYEVEPEPIRCITVDAEDSLYMVGRTYAVTHNTVTALGTIAHVQQRTLVVVDKVGLANQWRVRAHQFYGMPLDEFEREDGVIEIVAPLTKNAPSGTREAGLVGKGVWEERELTICLRQTLHERAWALNATGWWQKWGMVIYDECHHLSSDTLADLARCVTAKRVFGISATPAKSPTKSAIVTSLVGPIVHETERQVLYDRNVLIQPRVEVVHGNFFAQFWNDHDSDADGACQVEGCPKAKNGRQHSHRNNYTSVLKKLVEDKDRAHRIARRIMLDRNHVHLVASRQLKHLDLIKKALIEEGWPATKMWMLRGEENAKGEDQLIVQEISASDEAVVFSTVADEALDVPPIDRVHVAFPMRDQGAVIQLVGRGERSSEKTGKADAVILDYREPRVDVFEGQWYERERTYLMQGYPVRHVELEREIEVA